MAGDLNPSSTHPPLPPTTEDIRFSHLRLLRSRRVGVSTYHRLLGEHGDADAALHALPQIAADAGLTSYEPCPEAVVQQELRLARKAGATLLIHGYASYPDALMDLEDAPPLLWAVGNLELLSRPGIAFAGARRASALGARTAGALARDLAREGFAPICGLGSGIEASVHAAASEIGTIGVAPSGVDVPVLSENRNTIAKMQRCGLQLSSQPIGAQPRTRLDPSHARLIAGLGRICVMVEAAMQSDGMRTAREATDLGRDVLAVPGHPFDARSAGCNALIRDGATLIRGAQDVMEAMRPIAPPAGMQKLKAGQPVTQRLSQSGAKVAQAPEPMPNRAALHTQILERLGPDPVAIDHLIRSLKARPGDLGHVLTELELNGDIRRHAGGLLSRVS